MRRDLIERYRDRLHGVLSCYDRIVVTGTLPQVCYAEGMTAFLKAIGFSIMCRGSRPAPVPRTMMSP